MDIQRITAQPGCTVERETGDVERLWDMYSNLGSVHRVASIVGVSGQTVKAWLNRAGYRLNNSAWSADEINAVREYYANTEPANFSIAILARALNRTFAAVALKASRLGLSGKRTDTYIASDSAKAKMSEIQKAKVERLGADAVAAPVIKYCREFGSAFRGRAHSKETKARLSQSISKAIAVRGHPKGMLGKHHGPDAKAAISAAQIGKVIPREQVIRMMKTRIKNGTMCRPRPECSWKASWIEVGGKRFYSRSRWEANYGRYLQWLKNNNQIKDWEHEPETFWFDGIKRGCVSYLPDFRVTLPSGAVEYHEVKGWMDARSKTKIERMAKYHPEVTLKVINAPAYKALARSVARIVPGWGQ